LSRTPRKTDTFRWRLVIGAALVGGGYAAWLLIPSVLSSELDGDVKGMIVAALGATPLATKILAIALLGRPTFNYLKKKYGLLGG
jgi:hypothetical protein